MIPATPKISIRYQQISDAKRFMEILLNPNFIYFYVKPRTLKAEKEFLRQNPKKRKDNLKWNYSILYKGKVVGAVGIKINQFRKYIGEIGYFVDEKYWGKDIATASVQLVEEIAINKLKLKRLEILTHPKNKASLQVAIKCGYKKEGHLRKIIEGPSGELEDAYIFGKVV